MTLVTLFTGKNAFLMTKMLYIQNVMKDINDSFVINPTTYLLIMQLNINCINKYITSHVRQRSQFHYSSFLLDKYITFHDS